jgi:hypothetical protein
VRASLASRSFAAALVAAGLALAGAAARGAAADDGTAELGATRLTAPARRLVVHAMLAVNLSKEAAGSPVSIAPDLWFGATRGITLGVVHSSRATTGLFGGAGDGLCLTGEPGGCAKVYDRGGLLARVHLAGGGFSLALDGGVLARSLDPMVLSAKAGLAARAQLGKLAFELTPNVWIGLSEREAGNREVVHVPVSLSYALGRRLALAAQAGMIAPFEDFRDEVVIAASVGAQAMVGAQTSVDLVFSLPRWLDTDRSTYGLDARTFTFGVGRAF